jgi:hypothetical protein
VPAYAHVPIISILSDFGATDFLPSLENFLCMSHHTSRSAPKLLPNTVLSLYKCMTVRLPPASQVSKLETKDVIRARRAIPAHGKTLAVPCQFDTVLARESDDVDRDLQHPLDGTLQVIFCFSTAPSSNYYTLRFDSWSSPSHIPTPRGVWDLPTPSCICRMVHIFSNSSSGPWYV